jgi:hypothetical protein
VSPNDANGTGSIKQKNILKLKVLPFLHSATPTSSAAVMSSYLETMVTLASTMLSWSVSAKFFDYN